MPVGDYGYHILNGQDIAVDPDQRDIFLPVDGFNEFQIYTYIYDYMDTPLLRVRGGDDGNRFLGHPAIVFGGAGDDIFFNNGIDAKETFVNADSARSYGFDGRDSFFDYYGSTEYFGGTGRDFWTNDYFTTHAFEDDHDIVKMGRGRDTAHVSFGTTSGENGPVLEDRTIDLYGGKGIDTLSLFMSNSNISLTSEREIDFRDMGDGPMTLGYATFSGFERLSIEIGDGSIAKLHGTERPDDIIWFETDETRTEALRLNGHGGNDLIIGSYGKHVEFVYGGDGADIITGNSGGGSGWEDYLFGGRGADLIYAKGIGTAGTGKIEMTGDQGKDVFAISPGANVFTISRIKDFEVAKDKIAIDFTFSYSILRDDPRASLQDVSSANFTIQRDDETALRFSVDMVNRFDVTETLVFAYLQDYGSLRYYDNTDWVKLTVLEDAPTLTIDHFQFFDYA